MGSDIGCEKEFTDGEILRNENGRILALFSGPLGILDPNIVEVMAIKVALGMFVRSIWQRQLGLVIESDSMIAVRWCSEKDSRPWKLWGVFRRYRQIIGRYWKCYSSTHLS